MSDQYKRAYVAKHSQFTGFGCCSSGVYLTQKECGRYAVHGVSNLVVGDASAVRPDDAMIKLGFHYAAGVDGVMRIGHAAANELLSSLSGHSNDSECQRSL